MNYPQKTYDFVIRVLHQVKTMYPRIHTGMEDNIVVDFDNSLVYKMIEGQKRPVTYDELNDKLVTVFNIIGHTISMNNHKNLKSNLQDTKAFKTYKRKTLGIRKAGAGINVSIIHLAEHFEEQQDEEIKYGLNPPVI